MTNSKAKLVTLKILDRIRLIFYMLQHCAKFPINKSTVAAFIRKQIRTSVTKQLLNMFKL